MRHGLYVFVLLVSACGGAETTLAAGPTRASAASETVRCSHSAGPLIGPADTVADAGDVQDCGPGGQCQYLIAPLGSPPTSSNSPVSPSGWFCVYAGGAASSGVDGG